MADQRYWRLYQFAFVGLRNTSDVAHTQSGEKLGLSSNVAVVHRWYALFITGYILYFFR